MISDYRLDPFTGQINIREITGEEHTIPSNSPYTVRLNEVPYKGNPSTLKVYFRDNGAQLTEVAAQPASYRGSSAACIRSVLAGLLDYSSRN